MWSCRRRFGHRLTPTATGCMLSLCNLPGYYCLRPRKEERRRHASTTATLRLSTSSFILVSLHHSPTETRKKDKEERQRQDTLAPQAVCSAKCRCSARRTPVKQSWKMAHARRAIRVWSSLGGGGTDHAYGKICVCTTGWSGHSRRTQCAPHARNSG